MEAQTSSATMPLSRLMPPHPEPAEIPVVAAVDAPVEAPKGAPAPWLWGARAAVSAGKVLLVLAVLLAGVTYAEHLEKRSHASPRVVGTR